MGRKPLPPTHTRPAPQTRPARPRHTSHPTRRSLNTPRNNAHRPAANRARKLLLDLLLGPIADKLADRVADLLPLPAASLTSDLIRDVIGLIPAFLLTVWALWPHLRTSIHQHRNRKDAVPRKPHTPDHQITGNANRAETHHTHAHDTTHALGTGSRDAEGQRRRARPRPKDPT